MIGVVVFIFPLYYLYEGDRSGTIIAQFSTLLCLGQEFTMHWKVRFRYSIPLWIFLVPGSIYTTYLTSGTNESIYYTVSILGVLVTAILYSIKNKKNSPKAE